MHVTVRLEDKAPALHDPLPIGHTHYVRAVAFSPDGKTVASASGDSTVRLWDTATGTARQTLKGHTSDVNAVAFSPDGKTVASASGDRTVRLWDTATGTARQPLKDCSIEQLAFSREGPYLETDRGLLYIESVSANLFAANLQPHRTVFVRGNWITEGETNILWLPS